MSTRFGSWVRLLGEWTSSPRQGSLQVVDPAVVIDMSEVDVAAFVAGLEELHPSLTAARNACEGHVNR